MNGDVGVFRVVFVSVRVFSLGQGAYLLLVRPTSVVVYSKSLPMGDPALPLLRRL